MHCQQAAVQDEKHIFAFSIDGANAAVLGVAGDMRNGLWLRGNRMEDVNATDSPTLNERTERANDSFHFREFRHDRSTESRTRLESERVLPRLRLGSIAERGENGFTFVPVGKLIGIMAAAGLAGLPRRNEQNGFIPVSGVTDEAHRRAERLSGRAYAVRCSRLRFIGDAEELFQEALTSEGMVHVQRVEVLPCPVFDPLAFALLRQPGHGEAGGGHDPFSLALITVSPPFPS